MDRFQHADMLRAMCEAGAKPPKKGEEENTTKTPAQILSSLVLSCPTRRVHLSLSTSAVVILMFSNEVSVTETCRWRRGKWHFAWRYLRLHRSAFSSQSMRPATCLSSHLIFLACTHACGRRCSSLSHQPSRYCPRLSAADTALRLRRGRPRWSPVRGSGVCGAHFRLMLSGMCFAACGFINAQHSYPILAIHAEVGAHFVSLFLRLALAPTGLPVDVLHVSLAPCPMPAITAGIACVCVWRNRRLAAKAGGVSPLYHVLVAHECSLLPSISVSESTP